MIHFSSLTSPAWELRTASFTCRTESTVFWTRVMFFDFSSAFNTIHLALLGEKMAAMQVEAPIVSWIEDYLKGKVEDLENRSRRSNLRFINVPAKSEMNDMVAFVSRRLIPALLGEENFPTAPVVERAHRTPAVSSGSGGSDNRSKPGFPRPIIVKFTNFQDKVKIMRLARERGHLSFGGVKVFIYPDFSPQTVKKRREFDEVKKKLRAADIKYSLLYPSTLRVIVDEKPKLFHCCKEADEFFQDLPPG